MKKEISKEEKTLDESIFMDGDGVGEDLKQELGRYLVKYPDDTKIDNTIDLLRHYVPKRKQISPGIFDRFTELIKHVGREMSVMNKLYFLISIALFIVGYVITLYSSYNPMLVLMTLSPLPFAFGLLEVFKGRDQGLLEMEMTCKFSAYEIMLARLFIIGVFNILLNTILMFLFVKTYVMPHLIHLLSLWLTPFILWVGIGLWLSIMLRGKYFIMSFLSLWAIVIGLITYNPGWSDKILNLPVFLHGVLIIFGLIIVGFQMKRLIKTYSFYEGDEAVGVMYK